MPSRPTLRRPSASRALRDDLRDVEARQRQRFARQLEGDVRGVVRAHEEVTARGRETLRGAREVRPRARVIAAPVLLERGTHPQDRQRDLRVLVRAELPRRLAHHLQKAEGSAVRAVSQNSDVAGGLSFHRSIHIRARSSRGHTAAPSAAIFAIRESAIVK